MERKQKRYFRINAVTLLFIVMSFISVTLAWFAYSGLVDANLEVDIKAWNIELEKEGQKVSNKVIISTSDLYPGMDLVVEQIKIKNLGDSDAKVNYEVAKARLLTEESFIIDGEEITTEYVEDRLAHEYPFHVNINLTKNYSLAKEEDNMFTISLSWPLDSGNDELDSYWGNKAYEFKENEKAKQQANPDYKVKSSLEVTIKISAEQYLEEENAVDYRFNLGDEILYDVVSNASCQTLSSSCLKAYVIDKNLKVKDNLVTLLLNPNTSYLSGGYADYDNKLTELTSNWNVIYRGLKIEDILQIISTDVLDSKMIIPEISDRIIGNLSYGNRLATNLNYLKLYQGYYQAPLLEFDYLSAASCYWLDSSYDSDAFVIEAGEYIQIKKRDKLSSCQIVPVIKVDKSNLITD